MNADADRIARAALLLLESHDHDGLLRTLPAPRVTSLSDGRRTGVERIYDLTSPLNVTLVPEGLSHKLVKLVRHELQTGDRDFDAKVYITTDTPTLAAALLDIAALRSAILPLIVSGGRVEMTPDSVALSAWTDTGGTPPLDDRAAATILAYVEAVARPPEV